MQITSEEVVRAFIERIGEVNPTINAVVDNCFEKAIAEARAVDEKIQSGTKDAATMEIETPFLGVPFTIKDCFSVKGDISLLILSQSGLIIGDIL